MTDRAHGYSPRAMISRSALRESARRALSAAGSARIADLRRDAWGHGLPAVAAALAEAGAQGIIVDDSAELGDPGIPVLTAGTADVDPRLLYGLPAADGSLVTPPVMRLRGSVLSVKPLRAGEGVSYGYLYRAERDTTVALVSGGYAQGIVRGLGNRIDVEIDGALHPVVGRVAMDACVVELGGAEPVVGSEATFFGGRGPLAGGLARWAAVTGLSVPELVCAAGRHALREEED